MGGGPREQGACRFCLPSADGPQGGGSRQQGELGCQDGMSGPSRHGTHQVVSQCVEASGQWREQALPGGPVGTQVPHGDGQVAVQHRRAAAVEGVGEVGCGVRPAKSVAFEIQGAQVGGYEGHGVYGRAVVVQQAGHGQFAAAGAAADGVGGFQDGDGEAGLGERDGAGEAVGACSHDEGVSVHFRVPLVCRNQRR